MARPRRQAIEEPKTFVSRTLYRLIRFGYHIRRELAIATGLLVTASVAWMIYGTLREEPVPGPLAVPKVPLDNDNVLSWVNEAHKLTEHRKNGSFRVRVQNLPAFIEWARAKPNLVGPKLEGMDLARFLGIALSIDNSRKRLKQLVEYDLRAQAEEKILENNPDLEIPQSSPPQVGEDEAADLKVYEYHFNTIEAALADMLPGIRLPVAAWEEQEPSETEGSETAAPANKVTWRVVNRSRYGPRVINVR